MKKIISIFSTVVICLFFLSLFGWMSVHTHKGDKNFGFLNKPIKFMYSFLDQFGESVEEVKKMSPTFLPIWSEVKPINELSYDVNVLTAFSEDDLTRTVAILNLRNDSIVYKWNISETFEEHDRIVHPLLLPKKDLIYSFTLKTGLRRIDSLGNVKWKQDSVIAHHSLNADSAGNLWICSRNVPSWLAGGHYKINNRNVYYEDDYVTQINSKTGEILFHKSITNIMRTNDLSNYILQAQTVRDPIHLNDVQPALKTTKYYKEGDVFLSIKQTSLVLHYRPSTNKVLRVIHGPFSAQHDIDFLNDTTLTWFNNNSYELWKVDTKPNPKNPKNLEMVGDFYSNIVKYDFGTNEISIIGDSLFRANYLFTSTEGLHEFINDSTYFVEQQNVGYIWIIQNNKVIYKNVYKSQHEGYCHLPNWTRIIKE